jgi:hypothetical protein
MWPSINKSALNQQIGHQSTNRPSINKSAINQQIGHQSTNRIITEIPETASSPKSQNRIITRALEV